MADQAVHVNPNLLDISSLINVEEETRSLQEALVLLGEIGVPVARITRDSVQAMFLTVPRYLKEIRNLTAITDADLLDLVLAQAIKFDIIKSVRMRQCTVQSLLKVARWTKKGIGAQKVAEAQRFLKLERKAASGVTPEQIAMAQGLDLMLHDLSATIKTYRQQKEGAIMKYQQKIDKERRKMAAFEEKMRAEYGPAAGFKLLSKEEMSRRCWVKYLDHCKARRVAPMPRSSIAGNVEAHFSGTVQAEHRQEYVADEAIATAIDAWMQSQILGLESAGDHPRFRKFQKLLGRPGGGEDVELHADGVVKTSEVGARGAGDVGDENIVQRPFAEVDESDLGDGQEGDRDVGEAAIAKTRHSLHAKKPVTWQQHKNKDDKGTKKRKYDNHPHRKE